MTDILKQLDEAEKAASRSRLWGFIRYYNLIENDKNKKVALLAGQTGSKLTPEGHLIILMRNNIRALIDVAKAAEELRICNTIYVDRDGHLRLEKALAKLRGGE